jgi:hypothetical protein
LLKTGRGQLGLAMDHLSLRVAVGLLRGLLTSDYAFAHVHSPLDRYSGEVLRVSDGVVVVSGLVFGTVHNSNIIISKVT